MYNYNALCFNSVRHSYTKATRSILLWRYLSVKISHLQPGSISTTQFQWHNPRGPNRGLAQCHRGFAITYFNMFLSLALCYSQLYKMKFFLPNHVIYHSINCSWHCYTWLTNFHRYLWQINISVLPVKTISLHGSTRVCCETLYSSQSLLLWLYNYCSRL